MRNVLTCFMLGVILVFCSGSIPKNQITDEQLSNTQVEYLKSFCRVWGFLKYYHPYPSSKNVNWDEILITNYGKVLVADNKNDFNAIIFSISQQVGNLKALKHEFTAPDSLSKNADFSWLRDTSIFDTQNIAFLLSVMKNHTPFRNKYVKKTPNAGNPLFTESAYSDSIFPSQALRYLALARYWNIIEYYCPNKYLTDILWSSTLTEAIPIFQQAANPEAYLRALEWVSARINDGHASYIQSPIIYPKKIAPIGTFFHNDSLFVTYIANDSLENIVGLQKGDQIISIDGRSVKERWEDIIAHHSYSNYGYAEYQFGSSSEMLRSDNDTSAYIVNRAGSRLKIKVKNYSFIEVVKLWTVPPHKKRAESNIYIDNASHSSYGYLNMETLTPDEVNFFFDRMDTVSTLIIDVRNYPSNFFAWRKVANHLINGRQKIAICSYPNYGYPGYIKYNDIGFKVGSRCKKVYSGTVLILTDHSTISQAEYAVMAFKLAKKSLVIGTQTAGADGDISDVVLPGNYWASFTGIGWHYPTGVSTQRIGIIPDIKIDYTLVSELDGRDPILEKAKSLLRK